MLIKMAQLDQVIGPYVVIYNNTNNDLWLYGDMANNPVVNVGDYVNPGDLIGKEGNPSGTSSTGLHLHLEKENQIDGVFKYGYANSIDPVSDTGITNVVDSTIYLYMQTPPEPSITKKKRYNFILFNKRNRNLYR